MKNAFRAFIVVAAAGLYGAASNVWAADPLQVAPTMYKKVFEDDAVRVMTVTFKAGESIPEHSHPRHYAYVLEGGQLTVSEPGKPDSVADLTAGQVIPFPPVTHSARNTGKTQVKLLVTELKPATAPAKK